MAKKKGKGLPPKASVDFNVEGTKADLAAAGKAGKQAATGQLATISSVIGKNLGKQSGKYAVQTQKVLRNMQRIEQRNRLFQANRIAGAAATRQGGVGMRGPGGAVTTGRDMGIVARRQGQLQAQADVAESATRASVRAGRQTRKAGTAAVEAAPRIDTQAQKGTMSILDVLAAERQADDIKFVQELQMQEDLANAEFAHDIYMAKLNDQLERDREMQEEKKGKFKTGAQLFQRAMSTGQAIAVKAAEANARISAEDVAAIKEKAPPGTTSASIRRQIVADSVGAAGLTLEGNEYLTNAVIDHVIENKEAPEQEQIMEWASIGDDTGSIGEFIKKRPGRVQRIIGRLGAVPVLDVEDVRDPAQMATESGVSGLVKTAGAGAATAVVYKGYKAFRKRQAAAGAGDEVVEKATTRSAAADAVKVVKGQRTVVSPYRDIPASRRVADEMARLAENLPSGSIVEDVNRRLPNADEAVRLTQQMGARRGILEPAAPQRALPSAERLALPRRAVSTPPPPPRPKIPVGPVGSAGQGGPIPMGPTGTSARQGGEMLAARSRAALSTTGQELVDEATANTIARARVAMEAAEALGDGAKVTAFGRVIRNLLDGNAIVGDEGLDVLRHTSPQSYAKITGQPFVDHRGVAFEWDPIQEGWVIDVDSARAHYDELSEEEREAISGYETKYGA